MTEALKKGELLFLGTGAADWPYEVPPEENNAENRRWRRMSSVLVGGNLLIDCGPEVPGAFELYGQDPGKVTDLLLTHTHDDHYSEASLAWLAEKSHGLRVWGHKDALCVLPALDRVEKHPLELGETFSACGFTVTALEANHRVAETHEKTLLYLLKNDSFCWFYATDGAWLTCGTWAILKKAKLDLIVWDATLGDAEGDARMFEHNTIRMIRLMIAAMTAQGTMDDKTRIYLTHLARYCYPEQPDIRITGKPEMTPAWDGMRIRLS